MKLSIVTNKRPSVNNHGLDSYVESNDYESYENQPRVNIADVVQQRDEALKREEAIRDRMKLQETINSKQIQDLRSQVKKTTSENQKLIRGQTNTGVKSDKKKEINKNKEMRDLNKTIDLLRNEKIQLQNKIHEFSQFVKVMNDSKMQSSNLCREKDKHIQQLLKEKELAYQAREQEFNRRVQIQGELNSLQSYFEFRARQNRENTRSKSVQTITSIPMRTGMLKRTSSSAGKINAVSFSNAGNMSVGNAIRSSVNLINGTGATASYNALKSAASQWKLQGVEDNYKKETGEMRKKFVEARQQHSSKMSQGQTSWASIKHSNASPQLRHKTRPDMAFNPSPPPPPQNRSQLAFQGRFQFAKHSTTIAPAAIVYNARISVDNN